MINDPQWYVVQVSDPERIGTGATMMSKDPQLVQK